MLPQKWHTSVRLPDQYAVRYTAYRNPICQLSRPGAIAEAAIEAYCNDGVNGVLITRIDGTTVLAVRNGVSVPEGVEEILLVDDDAILTDPIRALNDPDRMRWFRPQPPPMLRCPVESALERHRAVLESWKGQFVFKKEQQKEGEVVENGLRPPQIGALHGVLAHWAITHDPCTVVMPTGTGKTETMLALLACERLERLLVVVPTDALRRQTACKFLTFGLLKKLGALGCSALFPVVGVLVRRLDSRQDVEDYFLRCNVIVTTMSLIAGCSNEARRALASVCSHLFIDEAHHVSATTWGAFRDVFCPKPVVQFTATPFRGDGRHVDGQVVFNYPLRKAQEDGYFRHINFLPVRQFSPKRSDVEIAHAAVRQLEHDLGGGLDHMVMARACSIARAQDIHRLYCEYSPEQNPLLIHSKIDREGRETAIRQIQQRESRIIVCVDMLGEGFDLAQLKIAALHDVHRSLAITLQFTGRFTRSAQGMGDATLIANIAEPRVEEALESLYAEDADWNYILRNLSDKSTKRQIEQQQFINEFTGTRDERRWRVSLQNVFPKMSTVVYRTKCPKWHPEAITDAVNAHCILEDPLVNRKQNVLVLATCSREPVSWSDSRDICNDVWDLYLLHWDRDRSLLFINSSNNSGFHEIMAKAVAGEEVSLIQGEQIYRSFHGIARLILMNLGLNHTLSRPVRFTMYAGADIQQGLSDAHARNKYKSSVFGRGYENGGPTSLGCSYRGRVWSHRVAHGGVLEWVEWCHAIGAKLIDDTISTDEIMAKTVKPKLVRERPSLVPLTIEWPQEMLDCSEDLIAVDVGGDIAPFYETGLEMLDLPNNGPLRFRVSTETRSAEYEVRFHKDKDRVDYIPIGTCSARIRRQRRNESLEEWFQRQPPIIRFEDGSHLEYNLLFRMQSDGSQLFDAAKIEPWVWDGTDITVESQTPDKLPLSIQRRVINELTSANLQQRYDIVFDDDGSNEVADIVALRVDDQRLMVHFFHCKYSSEPTPGRRVDDLYVVCGQAQRSVWWAGNIQGLLSHLRRRESQRLEHCRVSRFELGDASRLAEVQKQARFLNPTVEVYIVQPGLSRSSVSERQLDLLSVTELYLKETYSVRLRVISSP